MADAAHLLSDCISFIVALVAIWVSRKPPDKRMTFGYKRAGEKILFVNIDRNKFMFMHQFSQRSLVQFYQ